MNVNNFFKIGNKAGQRYKIDESSFKRIDSEISAYCLGFLYADGCVGKYKNDYLIRIHIHNSDKKILEFFASYFKTDKQIKIDKNGYAALTISNKAIFENLNKLGVVQRKTFQIRVPFSLIPDEFLHHFVRGYFDGDGSVTRNKNRISSLSVSVVSNIGFLDDLRKILVSKGFNKTKITPTKKNINIGSLTYRGAKNVKRFFDFIYSDSNFYLERKKTKMESFIKENLSKNEENQTKPYVLISPNGERIKIKTFSEFQKRGGLCKKSIYQLLKKEKESCKGWKIEMILDNHTNQMLSFDLNGTKEIPNSESRDNQPISKG